MAPVSTIGREATSFKIMTAKPLIRSQFPAQKTFGETFGAATGVSAPSYSGGFADWIEFLDRVSGDGVAWHEAGSNDEFVCS